MQASANPSSMSPSATQASVMRPTVATGIETCFLISRESSAWLAGEVPLPGIALPRLMVVPPETCSMSTPARSSCFAT